MSSFTQIIEQDGLPASPHTERVILGSMLWDAGAVSEALALLEGDDFSLESNRAIFESMAELASVGIDVDNETLIAELKRRKIYDTVGGISYIYSLTEGLPRNLVIKNYVKIVREQSVRRKILKACELAMQAAVDPSMSGDTVLGALESKILDISNGNDSRDFATFVDALNESGGIDAYVEEVVDPERAMGQRSGFTLMDSMTAGLQPQSLVVLAARPSMGKTAFAINIASNVADETDPTNGDRKVVAVFELEMSRKALYRRSLASDALVSIQRVAAGEFVSGEDRRKLRLAAMKQHDRRIFVDDTPSMTVLKLRAKARRLKQREGRLDLIIIDYLQLVSGSKRSYSNRQEEVSEVSRGLKILAKDLNVPVIALAQLNRASDSHSDKRPILASLRESGSIEQDADVVAFIHREEYYDRENPDVKGLAEIIIAKQREGPTGTVHLAYQGDYTKFSNLGHT